MQYWLMKSEPSTYSWDDFILDKETYWDGVRNYQARNNMRVMEKGDLVLFYHSVKNPSVVGVAKVTKEAYQDPTTEDPRWSVVNIKPVKAMKKIVTLSAIKAQASLADMRLVRQSRLSVSMVTKKEFTTILKMGEISL